MARIIERTEASGIGADDYVLLCSPTLGERKFKAIDLVSGGGGETKYYEYIRALNGQIVVRIEYPDAKRTYATKILWFFNGYDTDSSDKDIPSILIPYLPKNWSTDVMMTSGYTDSTSSTQLGWIGFLYPNQTPPSTKIRTWNLGKGGLESGSFWGVLNINGPEEQITEWFDPYENVPPSQIKNYGGTIEDGYNLNTNLEALGNVYHDSAMSYEIDNDSFDITWNQSGAYIGFSFNGDVDLKASDIQRLSYKINFGTCYDAANNQNIRPFIIGVTDTIRTTPSTGVYFDPSQVDNYFTKYKMYYKDVCNTTVEDYVDISDIEGPCYLFIVATGWVASITDLSMVSNCTPQIGTTLSQFNFFIYTNENSSTNRVDPIDTESFDVYWSGGINIGHCLTGAVPLSGKKQLDIDMDYIGENYQHSSGTHIRNHHLAVVVTDTKIDGYVNLDTLESQGHILAIKEWDGNDIYGQSIHTSIDLSNISGEYYINYQLPGFNISGFKTRLYSIDAILSSSNSKGYVCVDGGAYYDGSSNAVISFLNNYALYKSGSSKDGATSIVNGVYNINDIKNVMSPIISAEYSGYIYSNSDIIETLGLVLLGDFSQGGSSTGNTLSDSIGNYSAVILQGIYYSNRTSGYNTSMMYISPSLNTAYWTGMKDRNSSYDCYVTFTDNQTVSLSGNKQVIIYGIP